ncbi:MAG: phytanoyl-CoA dioxygenase family protein, partial [Hydrogenophaga sp.]|nr:phytanoyl-CoA dioxygenase family protein [Hydrogenophaga sp.]
MTSMTGMGVAATPIHAQPRGDDRYPSRFDAQVHITDRLDPVLYGSPDDGPLSASQLHFYLDNGYLNFDELLSAAEIQACLDEVQKLRSDDAVKASDRAVIEPGSGELRSLFEVHRSSAVLHRLANHPKLVGIARQLLGSEVYIH